MSITLKLINNMGKRSKEHRKKVAKRNEKIKQDQNRLSKIKNQIFQQIMKEKELGKFDDSNLRQLDVDSTDNRQEKPA